MRQVKLIDLFPNYGRRSNQKLNSIECFRCNVIKRKNKDLTPLPLCSSQFIGKEAMTNRMQQKKTRYLYQKLREKVLGPNKIKLADPMIIL